MKCWVRTRRMLAIALCAVILCEDTYVSKANAQEPATEYSENMGTASEPDLEQDNEGVGFDIEDTESESKASETSEGDILGTEADEQGEESFSVLGEISEVVSNVKDTVVGMLDDLRENGVIQIEHEGQEDVSTNNNEEDNDVTFNDITENDVSVNDISLNDISLNDISLNDISTNDISTNDVSLNDISENDISLLLKSKRLLLAKALGADFLNNYFTQYNITCYWPLGDWTPVFEATDNNKMYLSVSVYVNGEMQDRALLEYSGDMTNQTSANVQMSGAFNQDLYESADVKLSRTVNGRTENSNLSFWLSNNVPTTNADLYKYNGNTINNLDVYLTQKLVTVSTSDFLNLSLFNYKVSDGTINKNHTFKFFKTGEADKEDEPYYNRWTNDNDGALVVAGIVQNKLDKNGYPTLNVGNGKNKENLSYLFPSSTGNGVIKVASNTDYLFKQEYGYYVFDSRTEYAELNSEGTFQNNITDGTNHRGSYFNEDYMGRFSPFGEGNPGDRSNDQKDSFGMVLEIPSFIQPKNGQVEYDGTLSDMVFEFGGDDDVWIFIDDILVLDLGGIHQLARGTINYATGAVTGANVKNTDSYKKNNTSTTIYDAFKAAGVKNLDEIFVKNADGTYRFRDYSTHSLKMFYFERGGDKSNCQIKFNMPAIPKETISIGKNIDGAEKDKVDPNASYTFRLYADNSLVAENTTFRIYENGNEKGEGVVGKNGTFSLKSNQMAVFEVIEGTEVYVLAETDTLADRVVADGVEITETLATDGTKEFRYEIRKSGSVTFTNYFDTPITDLVPTRNVHKEVAVKDENSRIYTITLSADAYDTLRKFKFSNGELVVDTQTKSEPKTGDITDYITSEFMLTNEACNAITAAGGTYSLSEDGLYTIVSFDDISLNEWSLSFDVMAKEDFMGGNLIYTNVNEKSFVVIGDEVFDFEDPTVNVPVKELSLNSGNVILFLGDDITPETYVNLIDDGLSADVISVLLNNKTYSSPYSYSSYNGVTGELTYTLTEVHDASLETHRADAIGNPAETYVLTKTFTPLSVDVREAYVNADREEPSGNTAKEQSAKGSYDVYVIDGTLRIIKHINSLEYMKTEGDPIFTFKIEGTHSGKVYYKTVRFALDKLPSYISLAAGEAYIDVTITGLEKDEYVITELDTLGFVLEGLEATEDNRCKVNVQDGEIHAFIGDDVKAVLIDENTVGCDYGMYAEVSFSNRRRRSSDPRSPLTDTDTRKNRFVFGEVILMDENGDSGTTWNATTGENE